jgi:hypothetical protein
MEADPRYAKEQALIAQSAAVEAPTTSEPEAPQASQRGRKSQEVAVSITIELKRIKKTSCKLFASMGRESHTEGESLVRKQGRKEEVLCFHAVTVDELC